MYLCYGELEKRLSDFFSMGNIVRGGFIVLAGFGNSVSSNNASLCLVIRLSLICMRAIKISPPRSLSASLPSAFFFTHWYGLNLGFRTRAGPSNHESGWDLGQMGLKDFSRSPCEGINHSSLSVKDIMQQKDSIVISRWLSETSFSLGNWNVFIYVSTIWRIHGLPFVFWVVRLLPDPSRCPFFPSSLLPVRQNMTHSQNGFISSSLSSSLSLRIAPVRPVLVYADWTCCFRCQQNVDQLQFTSKQWTESRADSPLLFSSQSPSLNPWFLPPLFPSPLFIQQPPLLLLYCAFRILGVFGIE